MNSWSTARIALVLVSAFLLLPFLYFILFSGYSMARMHGHLPSDPSVIAAYDDVIIFLNSVTQSPNDKHELPESIQKLNPIFYKVDGQGVIIVFAQKYVENYGFYFTTPTGSAIAFCTEQLAPGIYRYYDPG